MPEPIPGHMMVEQIRRTFEQARASTDFKPRGSGPLGRILSVPDTHQKTALALLEADPDIEVVTCATEDEATTIAAGLYIGREPYIMMIQHAGLFASVNTLRGVAMDGRIPILYLIGLLSREKDRDPSESASSMVRYAEPLLNTFSVPNARLEGPEDVHLIPEYFKLAHEVRGPAALLVGLATS
jgi:sulfopyruvate decarboxylase TPP-binding subunit